MDAAATGEVFERTKKHVSLVQESDSVTTGRGERHVAMRNFINHILNAWPPEPSPESVQKREYWNQNKLGTKVGALHYFNCHSRIPPEKSG